MKELEPHPSAEQLDGDYVELKLVEPQTIRSFVENNTGYHELIKHSEEDLILPLQSVELTVCGNDLFANITFRPPETDAPSWKAQIADNLIAQIGVSGDEIDTQDAIIKLAHEDAFHVRISQDFYVRIEFDSNLESCLVQLEAIPRDQLEETLERAILYDENEPDIDLYVRLRSFASLWLKTINSVTSIYGNPNQEQRRHQLRLITPTIMEDKEAIETPNDTQNLMPSVEQATNLDDSFAMIGGLTGPKRRLQDIADVFRDPEGARVYGLGSSNFLLYGPSGTGKTSLVEAFAHELSATLTYIHSTELVDQYTGKSAKNTAEVFKAIKKASANGPIVMFFDEMDAIIGKLDQDHKERLDVVKTLNTEIVDIAKNYSNRIIIAGATNKDIDQLEDSIVRSGRLEPISAPLPTQDERQDIWTTIYWKSLRQFVGDVVTSPQASDEATFLPYANDFDPTILAQQTEGMTGADFEKILEQARLKQYRLYRTTGKKGVVTQHDILEEIQNFYRA